MINLDEGKTLLKLQYRKEWGNYTNFIRPLANYQYLEYCYPQEFPKHQSSKGGRFGTQPIRLQHWKFQPIREPYLAHVTGLAVRLFWGDWFRGIRTRPSAVGHGIEAGSGNDVTGPEMTSWQPEMEKKSRDTVIDRFKPNFNGFFHGVGALSRYSCRSGLARVGGGSGTRVVYSKSSG